MSIVRGNTKPTSRINRRSFNAEIYVTITVQAKIAYSLAPRIEGMNADSRRQRLAAIIDDIYGVLKCLTSIAESVRSIHLSVYFHNQQSDFYVGYDLIEYLHRRLVHLQRQT
jgi:hypothetical protein